MFGNDTLTPEMLMALGGGIMQGSNLGTGLGTGLQNASTVMAAQKEKAEVKAVENKTREWLKQQYPGENFDTMSTDMMKTYANEALKTRFAKPKFMTVDGKIIKLNEDTGENSVVGDYSTPKEQKRNLISTRAGIYDADTKEWIAPPEGVVDGGTPAEHGLNPIWGKKDGKLIFGTLDKAGVFHETALPEGFEPQPGTSTVDLGTTVVVRNNKTGDTVREMPKDIAGVEKQKVLGETDGKNIAAAPADLQAGLNAKAMIEDLKTDPNREWGTGWTGFLTGGIPATPAYDYQNKVNQAKSGAFLTAIQQLRGMGSLSNAEGDTATKAITRMNTATSEEAFLDALEDYEKIIDQGIAKAQSRLPSDQSPQPIVEGVNTTSSGVKWKVPGK